MDRLEQLGSSLSQITMYDLKSMYNQAKNVVLNVSETEAKVREATNDEPWGASSTLMQEIASGTFNFQQFNEIMPCIYARFMEKEASQWRQIYKALQLLEYLIKHGSERVVDDARAHISTIKMLRNFHYIDDKGKDEGINVRNRSRELAELLNDVEKIRTERRKAKANKSKYIGVGSDNVTFSSGGSRYGGFGSDSLGGGSSDHGRNSSYDSYSGGGGGSSSSGFRDTTSRQTFEEYDAGGDEAPRRSSTTQRSTPARRGTGSSTQSRSQPAPPNPAPPPKAKPVEVFDLLGDDDFGSAPTASVAAPAAPPVKASVASSNVIDDDDFDDFQAAPAAPQPFVNPTLNAGLMSMLGNPAPPVSSPPVSSPPPFAATNFGMMSPTTNAPKAAPNYINTPTSPAVRPAPPVSKPSSNFDDLWSMSLGSSKPAPVTGGKSIKDLEKEKSQAGIWGASQNKGAGAGGFGNFGGATSSNSGGDDLLL